MAQSSHDAHPHDPRDTSQTHIPQAGERLIELYSPGANYAEQHHGHTIVPQRVLITVLSLLLFFTFATVLAAWTEEKVAETLHIVIPQWVNVFVALSIAVVKAVIVALFFMQLKYDNPVNGLVAIFTIMTLAFFLGFTMIDLGSRDALYSYKAHEEVVGGTGSNGAKLQWRGIDDPKYTIPNDTPIAVFAREQADKKIEQMVSDHRDNRALFMSEDLNERFEAIVAELRAAGKPVPEVYERYEEDLAARDAAAGIKPRHEVDEARLNNADQSRPRTGITLPFLKTAGEHAEHHAAAEPAPGEHK